MRIKPEQLATHLKQEPAPLYLVFGDEPLLALEATDAIRAAARGRGYDEREVFTVESGFNWQTLLASGSNLSLFAQRRIVELRIPTGKPGTEGSKIIDQYCANLPPDTLTLVTCPKLDKTQQGSKWFKALEGAGVVVQVFPVERGRLPDWIAGRLAAQDQRAGRDTLQFLADRVEGNLLAAFQEIRKLGLLHPPGELTFEQVKEAVLDVSRYDVFNLAEAMLNGESARYARILEGLRGEGVSPVLVLWALAQDIRLLTKLALGQNRGVPLAQGMREARVWDSRQPLLERALKRLSGGRLVAALKRAAFLDRMIKGLERGDVWDECLQLGLKLTR
ncbi:MAG: DNA polymerase III subunit delta [Sulfuricella sp.]|nr:DNA polymerase III subunit delta [Sulfuricella sp.]